MKFKQLVAASMLVSTFALAACGAEPESVAEAEPAGVPGLSVENARLVLAPVAGNPAAVYFDLKYDGDRGLSIRRADVAGADEAQLHAYGEWEGKMQMAEAMPLAITKGTEISFKPGDLHVMAFNLDESVEAGGTVEVTLTVSGGDKYSFDANVRSAGDER
jgi:hypothetical protein